jgi:hypothetical protein
MISITPILCNNKMTRTRIDIMDAYNQNKRRRNNKIKTSSINQRLVAAITPPVVTTPRPQISFSKMRPTRR